MDGDVLEKVDEFCYLGDLLAKDGGTEAAVSARIASGWKKFRELSGVLCGRDVSNRVKGLVYKACVRSAMMYGCESWAMKVEDVRRMKVAEMRMLRYMSGVRWEERRTNEEVREWCKWKTLKKH